MAQSTCSVPKCDNLPRAKGYCAAHYRRFRKYGDPLAGRTPEGEPRAYFEAHVMTVQPECKLWPYSIRGLGYGSLKIAGQNVYVHVLACERWHGPRPSAGLEVCHGPCVSKLCFNGAHLRWGTRSSNMLDKTRDGVQMVGEAHHKTTVTADQVREMRARWDAGESGLSLAAAFDMSKAGVSRIVNRKSWTHLE